MFLYIVWLTSYHILALYDYVSSGSRCITPGTRLLLGVETTAWVEFTNPETVLYFATAMVECIGMSIYSKSMNTFYILTAVRHIYIIQLLPSIPQVQSTIVFDSLGVCQHGTSVVDFGGPPKHRYRAPKDQLSYSGPAHRSMKWI